MLAHPWFKSIDVDALVGKRIQAPSKPVLSKNIFDVSAFDEEFTGEEAMITNLDNKTMQTIS